MCGTASLVAPLLISIIISEYWSFLKIFIFRLDSSVGTFYFRNRKMTDFRFRIPYAYNNRIFVENTHTDASNVETVVILRIVFRTCNDRNIKIC